MPDSRFNAPRLEADTEGRPSTVARTHYSASIVCSSQAGRCHATAVFALAICLAAVVQVSGDENPEYPAPSWFVGKDAQGLHRADSGAVLFEGRSLSLDPPAGPRFGAAYYPKQGILVTVGSDGATQLYAGAMDTLKRVTAVPAKPRQRVDRVRFGRVPGLLYVFGADLDKEDQLRDLPFVQDSAEWSVRTALTDEAKRWYGMDLDKAEGAVIPGLYSAAEVGALVSLGPGRWLQLQLAEPPDFQNAPDPSCRGREAVWQCVFVFPDRAILARTQSGWSISNLDGTLRKSVSAPNQGWWQGPYFRNGAFTVVERTGPHSEEFRMDEDTGTLVRVKLH